MLDSPRILIFTDWYVPGFKAGGPIRSIANLVALLGPQAWVITGDRDLGDESPYADLPLNQWVKQNNGSNVMYCSSDAEGSKMIASVCKEFIQDTWYLNSMFSTRFTLSPMILNIRLRAKNRVILAPRGMLHPEALKIKSWKKKLFLKAMRITGFFQRVNWHATGEEEERMIHCHFGESAMVKVVPNVPTFHPFRELIPDLGIIQFIMISRLSEEKGVLEGLTSWFKIQELKSIQLKIIGPKGNPTYANEVLALMSNHPDWKVEYLGALSPNDCLHHLNQSHYLFSPTRGENYGHAIAEALFMGVPVLITDTTPWKNLEEKGWGWEYDSKKENFQEVMLKLLSMTSADYNRQVDHLRANRSIEQARWKNGLLQSFLFEKH